ncbi:Het-C domain-containing protein [Archangium gephyra]|uniref:hypothetical protein n=1 Tax=Archangium gephyra TaxID=48 RepID=UPI0035D49A7A
MPVLVLALLALPGPSAQAFCPTNGLKCGLGGTGVTHEDMTKQAMTELGAEFFGTPHQTRAMRSAIDETATANAEVDEDQANGFKHFDGESFAPGKQRLVTLFEGVILSLRAGEAQGARRQLGQALHTLQDFYSHSNWIESGHGGALPSLWRSGEPLPASAAAETPTCKECEPVILSDGSLFLDCGRNLLTPLLTSGFYGGENEVPAVPSKCRHGGPFDTGPGPSGGINKDTLYQPLSPHFRMHTEAADSALEASKQFIRDLQSQLTRNQLELLFGVGPTLTLAIGPTGGLGGLLAPLQAQLLQLVDSRLGTDQEPLRYVLVPFTDASTGPLSVMHDPAEFKRLLGSLGTVAGGGCSGPSMAAALQALGASGKGGELFLFTREGTQDGHLAPQVSSLAWHQGTRIHAFLFGSCEGLAGASLPPEYRQLTSETGGQLFRLQPLEAGPITHLIDATVRANTVHLLSVADERGGTRAVLPVPVDSTVSRVTFSLSGSPSLHLTRPDGSPVLGVEPGVQRVQLSTGVLVTVLEPAPGVWTATMEPPGEYSFDVLGESPVALDRFELVETAGRPGHQGYFALEGLPVLATPATAVARLSGGITSARVELRSPAGALLQELELTPAPGVPPRELTGTVVPPSSPFTVYARGTLPGGEPWQRVLTRRSQSQTVRLLAPPPRTLGPGTRTSYTFQVENSGAPGTFRSTVRDDRRFVTGVSPESFTLGSGERRSLTVQVEVPEDVAPGTADTLTATVESTTVESTSTAGARNFAVVTSVVGPKVTVDCGGARPEAAVLWPPNHGFVPVGVDGVTSSDGSPVHITIDQVLQSEAPQAPAEASTCPDVRGLGASTVELRAERSGSGPGRLYLLRFTASTDTGAVCTGSVQVCVPHGKKGTCPAARATFDSSVCR